MSEPGPESIPTSADPRSKRATKRRAVTPHAEQASQIQSLFRDPSKEVKLPEPSKKRSSASLPPPPEIVANVQGSSAGAGSGEFHVYKASRRREYERLRLMQSEVDREKADQEWGSKREEAKRKDDEKTQKNRKRREKRKAAKEKNHRNGAMDMEVDGAGQKRGPDSVNGDTGPGKDQEQGTTADGEPHGEEAPGVIIHED